MTIPAKPVLPRFPVSASKQQALEEKFRKLKLQLNEIQESFMTSGGPGGQNVNKRATCVYLKHIPTGLAVRCQKQRSQGLNRFLAWRSLVEKIEKYYLGQSQAEKEKLEKIRRQKKRRSRRLRLKVLREKRYRAEKKKLRARVREWE